MELATRYQPNEKESQWYDHWMEKNYFRSVPDERESFSIVIPPPNVTGVLHMGHMLNNTIQDILIRHARQSGKNACWVPGTDHASIATEAKVVKMLREKGIKKSDISREKFLEYAFEWKDKYGGIILEQLKQLGASADWERTRFTMEPSLSKAVIKVFVDLHKKGKIYRRLRMTNWDPVAQTALSNEEVIHKEENSFLFHIRYKVEGTDEYIVIATQRPETIMADAAVAVNPKDERFAHLVGKKVIIPLINKAVPVIADNYVDVEFGTGALKITPAHDPNDYEVGQRHKLEVIDILNADGTLNEKAQVLVGEDRMVARKKIKKLLEEADALVELEAYRTKIGHSERTDAVVEPRLTLQWFLDMKEFAKTALAAVKEEEVKFFPPHFWNMYYNWLNEDNILDWCISRQLWWGQQIPAWFYKDEIFVEETAEAALAAAQAKTGDSNLTLADLKQDEDVVDTWFSSWLWPISVFDGFESAEELKYYYPTNVLVTGWDIIFLWVARMIMAGYEWAPGLLGEDAKGKQPFDKVYFTGMVRDSVRRKMSKSLGNSPDALKLIENYGADGVRYGMLASAAAGNDIIFDAPIDKETKEVLNESKLCDQGLNFCNKMWNALRLMKGWEVVEAPVSEAVAERNALANEWFGQKLKKTLGQIEQSFEQLRLNEAIKDLYKFIWGDFCSHYLEFIKPAYGSPIDRPTLEQGIQYFETLMSALHPFMPFVTEEIWHLLKDRAEGEDCIVSKYPKGGDFDQQLIDQVETIITLISSIRKIRNEKGLKQKEPLALSAAPAAADLLKLKGLENTLISQAYLSGFSLLDGEPADNTIPIVIGQQQFFLEVNLEMDVDAEIERLQKDIDYQKGFLKGIEKKLSNERFVNNAPAKVIDLERKKQADAEAKIKHLQEAIDKLKK